MSGSRAGDQRAPADSHSEGIRHLLYSGAAVSGDGATDTGANVVTEWGVEGGESGCIPSV